MLSNDDKAQIIELGYRYARAVDDDDIDAWLATWTSDGELTAAFGSARGLADLRALETRLQAGFSRGHRHVVANTIVEGDSKTAEATSTSYLIIFEREHSPSVIATAVYHDTLRNIDGLWKFSKRDLRNDPNGKPTQ